MTTLKLRTANHRDTEAIETCIARAYADVMREIADLPDVTSGVAEDIGGRQVVVAEQEGTLLGVIIFDRQADAMMILNLAVSPDAQGQGIARQLLGRAETRASEAGLSTLRLRTHRLMTETRALYRYLGWQELEVAGNSVLMQKTVT